MPAELPSQNGLVISWCCHSQVLFLLFQLQLHLLIWQKDAANSGIERLLAMLEGEDWPQELGAFRQQAMLHLKILQVRWRSCCY